MAVTDFLTYIGYPYPEDHFRKDNPLNLYGVPAFSAEAELFITDVFMQLVRASDWPRRQEELWIQRYILGKSADAVAKYLKRTKGWVDEKYLQCQEKLSGKMKVWWTERLSDSPEKRLPEMLHAYIVKMCEKL